MNLFKDIVEFHCHGIGSYNFSDINSINLAEINELAAKEGLYIVPTVFLSHNHLHRFVQIMEEYSQQREDFPHILGFGMEGPLLGGTGGTPDEGTWVPTIEEWQMLFKCGEMGLIYMVYSCDFEYESKDLDKPEMDWITQNLIESGIKPALGHFQHDKPEFTAETIRRVVKVAERISPIKEIDKLIITDHLLNDMPRNIKHAWRSLDEKLSRETDLEKLKLHEWNINNIEEKMGIVPATLINLAIDKKITICMNFDGEHVDLEICKLITKLINPSNLIAMTDRTDINYLGIQELELQQGGSLWYQSEGKVAAGSTTVYQQIENLKSIGLDVKDINLLVSKNVFRILDLKGVFSN